MKNEESHSNKGTRILGLPTYRILIPSLYRHIVYYPSKATKSVDSELLYQTKAVVYHKMLQVVLGSTPLLSALQSNL